ncbi:GlxA family transcriptional regulator [Curvivirga sp.]|uniref:GlxA family transcriptional regulator n=1 Tax=Curvivirga sp. TaxID=2856848 RepID=UPI003B58E4E7
MKSTYDKQNTKARLSVGFILANQFTLNAFSNFIDVLRLSADDSDGSQPILCHWKVISTSMDLITSSAGIPVKPDETLGDPARFDYIAVVGGLLGEKNNLDRRYVDFLHQTVKAGVPLIGVCTGGFILHRAGLMSGRKCCVGWLHRDDFLEEFDDLEIITDQIFIVDGDRLTCSGGISAAHLAAYLVDKHVGVNEARKSLHIMIIDEAKSGSKPQPGIPLTLETSDDTVKHALLLMQQNMESRVTISNISKRLQISRRKLERKFQQSLNMTPAQAEKTIRIETAKHLMLTTHNSISEIAIQTGFCDASHFIRVFRTKNGMTPDQYRNESI